MGVGPFMADGSHEWRPNWVDFPVVARTGLAKRCVCVCMCIEILLLHNPVFPISCPHGFMAMNFHIT